LTAVSSSIASIATTSTSSPQQTVAANACTSATISTNVAPYIATDSSGISTSRSSIATLSSTPEPFPSFWRLVLIWKISNASKQI
jgi:hypothetical protein